MLSGQWWETRPIKKWQITSMKSLQNCFTPSPKWRRILSNLYKVIQYFIYFHILRILTKTKQQNESFNSIFWKQIFMVYIETSIIVHLFYLLLICHQHWRYLDWLLRLQISKISNILNQFARKHLKASIYSDSYKIFLLDMVHQDLILRELEYNRPKSTRKIKNSKNLKNHSTRKFQYPHELCGFLFVFIYRLIFFVLAMFLLLLCFTAFLRLYDVGLYVNQMYPSSWCDFHALK